MPRNGNRPLATNNAPLTVVLWKWGRRYKAEHVNALARQIARHYARPHRVLCVTNDPIGIDPAVLCIQDDADFDWLPSPHGGANPSCYRRLRLFRRDAAKWFGERFVSIDLDVVAVADLVPLWDRPEDFVAYRDPLYTTQYNGSMLLMTAGARPAVWEDFDYRVSPALARAAKKRGSDQAWLSYKLPNEATWGPEDGVYSYRKDIVARGWELPEDARLTVWHGQQKPWASSLTWVADSIQA